MASFKALESESLRDLVKNSEVVHPNVDKRIHKYKLNDKAAKAKIVQGAKRCPFEVKHNSSSSNLDFSIGAWNYVVLPTIRYWDQVKEESSCRVGSTVIKISSVELGKEAGGRHMDTKVVFFANTDRVVLHLYNTTQRILVNGHGYDYLIDIFLKPYFEAKLFPNLKHIDDFNKEVLAALSGKRKAVTRPTRSVRYKAISRPSCKQCDESFVNLSLLGAHTKSIHKRMLKKFSANISQFPMVDDSSLMDLSVDDSKDQLELEETCVDKNIKCEKCPDVFLTEDELKAHLQTEHVPMPPKLQTEDTPVNEQNEVIGVNCVECDFKAKDGDRLNVHMKSHVQNNEQQIFNCGTCENTYISFSEMAEHIDQQHKPVVVNVQISLPIDSLHLCEKCDFATEDVEELRNHDAKGIHNVLDQNKSLHDDDNKHVNKHVDKKEDDERIPSIPDTLIGCKKCKKSFINTADLEKHMSEDHIILNVYNCTACTYKFTAAHELKNHFESLHTSPLSIACEKCDFKSCDDKEMKMHTQTMHKPITVDLTVQDHTSPPSIACERCDYQSNDDNEMKLHTQTNHMTPRVDLNVPDQRVIRCNMCDYKCRYTIQYKKHMAKEHNPESKYSCKECDFTSNFIGQGWEHRLEAHPDAEDHFTEKETKNFVLMIVAEQTNSLMEEVASLKSDTKNAFKQLSMTVKTCIEDVKGENNEKCITLGNTVAKIYDQIVKMEKAIVRGKTTITEKQKKAPKSYAEIAVKSNGKKVDMKLKKPTVPSSSSPPSGPIPSTTASFKVPPRQTKSAPKSRTPFTQQPKVLYVGDSVGQTANLRIVEKSLNCRIKSTKAYSSTKDDTSKWPKKNFNDVVAHSLKNPGIEEYNVLVMSAPTVDITNIDTNESTKEEAEQKVINSSKNMFNIAQRTLSQNKSLTKVVLMEHPPRFDGKLKTELAKLANSTLGQMWVLFPLKGRIVIGRHSLESPGVGPTHLARYKDNTTGRYDAVHFYGRSGVRHYTDSVKTILMIALTDEQDAQPKPSTNTHEDHLSEEQAQYQWRQTQSKQTNRQTNSNKTHRSGTQAQPRQSVPTQNRFEYFNQGNY